MRTVLIALLMFCVQSFAASPTKEPEVDPIIGHWVWGRNNFVTFKPDHTTDGNRRQGVGRWKYLENKEVERKYQIVWRIKGGKIFIDHVTLSRDGSRIEGWNQEGDRIIGHRGKPKPI
jgi:hypothetical protein